MPPGEGDWSFLMAEMTFNQRKILRQTYRLMSDQKPVLLVSNVQTMFLVLVCLQYAWRDEALEGAMRDEIKRIGEFVQSVISQVHPGCELTFQAGWDLTQDVHRDQTDEIDEELRNFLKHFTQDGEDVSGL